MTNRELPDLVPASSARPRLPEREWLRLQEAMTFAFHGIAFSSRVDSLTDLSKVNETLTELRYPSIYGSIDVMNYAAMGRVHAAFNNSLSEAGLAGRVKFRCSDTDIHISRFLNIRDFSTLDDTIRPNFDASNREIDAELRDVMVERKSFLKWFKEAYPSLCGPSLVCTDERSDGIALGDASVVPKVKVSERVNDTHSSEWLVSLPPVLEIEQARRVHAYALNSGVILSHWWLGRT